MTYWAGKHVLVTGGFGFVGHLLVKELIAEGATVSIIDNMSRGKRERLVDPEGDPEKLIEGIRHVSLFDLRSTSACRDAVYDADVVFHLAAPVGGLYWSMIRHYDMFSEAMATTINIMDAAIKSPKTKRIALASSACAYSAVLMGPHHESEAQSGNPEESSEGYGWAKRLSENMAKWARDEHDMEVAVFRPANAIGPDDIDDDTGHVIPQVLKRIFDGQDPLVIYGTGTQKREFMHIRDYVGGAMAICERAADGNVVNLGSGHVVTIGDLVNMLLDICVTRHGIKWPRLLFDTNKVDGHPAKFHLLTKLREEVGYVTQVSLDDALVEIVDDYALNRAAKAETAR